MPKVGSELSSQYFEPVAIGPVAQVDMSAALGAPATIAASSSWVSGVIPADGYKAIALAVTLSNAGTLKLTRYLDTAGTIAQGAAQTQALTAATPGNLNVNDGAPFQSFKVEIDNSGASVANVSGFACLLNAQ
jgi:hypothetical protein